MDKWMDKWMDEWMDKWMNECMYGWMDLWIFNRGTFAHVPSDWDESCGLGSPLLPCSHLYESYLAIESKHLYDTYGT